MNTAKVLCSNNDAFVLYTQSFVIVIHFLSVNSTNLGNIIEALLYFVVIFREFKSLLAKFSQKNPSFRITECLLKVLADKVLSTSLAVKANG